MRFLLLATLYGASGGVLISAAVGGVLYARIPDWYGATLIGGTAGVAAGLVLTLIVAWRLTAATREPSRDPETFVRQRYEEKLVMSAPAVWMRGLRPRPGYVALTNQRVLFIPRAEVGPTFNIPLDNVRSVRRFRLLHFIKLGMKIQRHDRDHESVSIGDYSEWHDKINHARRARRPTWVNTGTVKPI